MFWLMRRCALRNTSTALWMREAGRPGRTHNALAVLEELLERVAECLGDADKLALVVLELGLALLEQRTWAMWDGKAGQGEEQTVVSHGIVE